ncbi:MAG: FHA domain-containing protein [Lachnospiraceae bacterium]
MNLCRCENGHFYDKEKYPTCPHCKGGSASDEKRTVSWWDKNGSDGATVPVDNIPDKPSISVQQKENPFEKEGVGSQPAVQQIPFNTPPAVRGFSANDITIGGDNGDTPTVPWDPNQSGDDDDGYTKGYFDDAFKDMTKESANRQTVPGVQTPAPHVNKVSTPCVGWLVALGGEHIGTDFRLKVGKNFIGRSPKMDIALTEDKSVSRERHAIVVYDPKSNMYLIQPGDSSSLAYHNNNLLLTPEKLEAYDMITVGDVNLLFMPLCSAKFSWGSVLDELKKKHE